MRSLSDIQADLDIAYSERRKAMASASLGIGGRNVTRQQLEALSKTIQQLEQEKSAVEAASCGRGSLTFIPTARGW